MYKMQIEVELPAQRVQDMFVGAFEGGSNYWLEQGPVELIVPAPKDMPEDGVLWYGNSKRNIFDGHFVITIFHDGETRTVTEADVQQGLDLMAKNHRGHFNALSSETDDAITADVFLQLVLFKEIVYG